VTKSASTSCTKPATKLITFPSNGSASHDSPPTPPTPQLPRRGRPELPSRLAPRPPTPLLPYYPTPLKVPPFWNARAELTTACARARTATSGSVTSTTSTNFPFARRSTISSRLLQQPARPVFTVVSLKLPPHPQAASLVTLSFPHTFPPSPSSTRCSATTLYPSWSRTWAASCKSPALCRPTPPRASPAEAQAPTSTGC
jgi:hypothetical protein